MEHTLIAPSDEKKRETKGFYALAIQYFTMEPVVEKIMKFSLASYKHILCCINNEKGNVKEK